MAVTMRFVQTKHGLSVLVEDVIALLESVRPPDRPGGERSDYYYENGRRDQLDELLAGIRTREEKVKPKVENAE